MTLEKTVEDLCCVHVQDLGGLAFKLVSPGRRGRADRLFILPGPRFLLVEFKRPKGGRVSALQRREQRLLAELGVEMHVCRTLAAFRELIDD